MNIKEAKEEIIHTVQAYTAKDEDGNYRILPRRQRPLLLIGPPGIGKTAVMEQAAAQCQVGLVSYTITHHTRQSAVGLPLVEKKEYGGREYTVTEYTMSEIVASVYEQMELTGKKEGILFIDEINCVSETLAPTMLQFLQCKTFGNHKIPQGWVIAAAGNPEEYNRSARELDMVTLDRVRRISIEADVSVWREYAQQAGIHGAVLSYLELRPQNFYSVEGEGSERKFVTARGWEDLSELLKEYERQVIPVTEIVVGEYLQNPAIAEDFYSYYRLYQSYRERYPVRKILDGTFCQKEWQFMKECLRSALVDERLSAVQMFLSGIHSQLQRYERERKIVEFLTQKMAALEGWGRQQADRPAAELAAEFLRNQERALHVRSQTGILSEEEERREEQGLRILRQAGFRTKEWDCKSWEDVYRVFLGVLEERKRKIQEQEKVIDGALDRSLVFLEECFAEGQEMLVFLSDLSRSPDAGRYLKEHSCPRFEAHKDLMMVEEQEEKLRRQLEKLSFSDPV